MTSVSIMHRRKHRKTKKCDFVWNGGKQPKEKNQNKREIVGSFPPHSELSLQHMNRFQPSAYSSKLVVVLVMENERASFALYLWSSSVVSHRLTPPHNRYKASWGSVSSAFGSEPSTLFNIRHSTAGSVILKSFVLHDVWWGVIETLKHIYTSCSFSFLVFQCSNNFDQLWWLSLLLIEKMQQQY